MNIFFNTYSIWIPYCEHISLHLKYSVHVYHTVNEFQNMYSICIPHTGNIFHNIIHVYHTVNEFHNMYIVYVYHTVNTVNISIIHREITCKSIFSNWNYLREKTVNLTKKISNTCTWTSLNQDMEDTGIFMSLLLS